MRCATPWLAGTLLVAACTETAAPVLDPCPVRPAIVVWQRPGEPAQQLTIVPASPRPVRVLALDHWTDESTPPRIMLYYLPEVAGNAGGSTIYLRDGPSAGGLVVIVEMGDSFDIPANVALKWDSPASSAAGSSNIGAVVCDPAMP